MDAEPAQMRVSDAERQAVIDELTISVDDGRLSLAEFRERTRDALRATTQGELDQLTHDLPAHRGATTASTTSPATYPSTERPSRSWIFAILGGNTKRGSWKVPERLTVLDVMGGAELDMSRAELSASETVVTVFSMMGGAKIKVPAGVNVEVGGLALLAGHDATTDPPPPGRDVPTIRFRLYSLMGGVEIKTSR